MPSIADLCGARKRGGASLVPIRYLGFFLPEISIQPASLTGCHYRGTTIGGPNVTLTVGATQAIELSSNLLRTAQVRRCSLAQRRPTLAASLITGFVAENPIRREQCIGVDHQPASPQLDQGSEERVKVSRDTGRRSGSRQLNSCGISW